MFARSSEERSHLGPRDVGRVSFKDEAQKKAVCENYRELASYGICLDSMDVQAMSEMYMRHGWGKAHGMDVNLTTPLTTASITTPIQFLQAWLPGFTEVITAARRIDDLVGITTQGSWEDEEIVQGVLEKVGNAALYFDQTSTPADELERKLRAPHDCPL